MSLFLSSTNDDVICKIPVCVCYNYSIQVCPRLHVVFFAFLSRERYFPSMSLFVFPVSGFSSLGNIVVCHCWQSLTQSLLLHSTMTEDRTLQAILS